mmetsp:Transcript_41564/g.118591  ORF Transcript_41564/g.118591 Transcript_41564/m.118591 type:complete len:109 (+) Transcript_41564:204-530(+)
MICASRPLESAMSDAKVPCCSTRPLSESTATASQQRMTDRLCVTTSVVGLLPGASSVAVKAAAVAVSSADVGSSRTSTGARRSSARAVARRWRSPPERSLPPGPTGAA